MDQFNGSIVEVMSKSRFTYGKFAASALIAALAWDASALPVAEGGGNTVPHAAPAARLAQTAPSKEDRNQYQGLHAAVARGDIAALRRFIAAKADLDARDGHGRTALMVAAHRRDLKAADLLMKAGADVNALDVESYDVLTIASVLNDLAMVRLAIASGADARLITSPYEGTALIAAAHLGHAGVVRALIAAKAPLDHVNNLGWTALIESIVLGDGGPNHVATLRALVDAGADVNLADATGVKPLTLASQRGHDAQVRILEKAGARP